MKSELKHQLYGGEISDYMEGSHVHIKYEDPQQTDSNIANVYDAQVKGKPSIDTTGIVSLNFGNIPRARDPHFDALDAMLKETLSEVAKQIGLDADTHDVKSSQTITLKDQTNHDIENANNNVLQALKELKDLNAI